MEMGDADKTSYIDYSMQNLLNLAHRHDASLVECSLFAQLSRERGTVAEYTPCGLTPARLREIECSTRRNHILHIVSALATLPANGSSGCMRLWLRSRHRRQDRRAWMVLLTGPVLKMVHGLAGG